MRRQPLERTIVAKVMAVARGLGWWVYKTHGGSYGTVVGLPDVLCIRDGHAAWIECKRPGEPPTRIQEHRMRELASCGCHVTVATSASEARNFLQSIK